MGAALPGLDWTRRDLRQKRYVYVWADGIYSRVRLDDRLCLLVIIGSDENGRKELLVLSDGYRESVASWEDVLRDLRQRGLKMVHKTANAMEKLSKAAAQGQGGTARYMARETREEAYQAFDHCIERFEPKYPKAMACLAKVKDAMLAFYDNSSYTFTQQSSHNH